MQHYQTVRERRDTLFRRYNVWYSECGQPHGCRTDLRTLFKEFPRVLKRVTPVDEDDIARKALYRELRLATRQVKQAWHRYMCVRRFNLVRVAVYRQTRVDVSFAREKVLSYIV